MLPADYRGSRAEWEQMASALIIEEIDGCSVLHLDSIDGTNRLTRACVLELTKRTAQLAADREPAPLIVTGNAGFFSAGADLEEVVQLDGPSALEFSRMGQELMRQLGDFPAPVYAAISGYCMGGGLDLVLACRYRICSPSAIFGHRGAALGLITGWGGTQRLPRLIGKAQALALFVTAAKITATKALQLGLVDAIGDDPVADALHQINARR